MRSRRERNGIAGCLVEAFLSNGTVRTFITGPNGFFCMYVAREGVKEIVASCEGSQTAQFRPILGKYYEFYLH